MFPFDPLCRPCTKHRRQYTPIGVTILAIWCANPAGAQPLALSGEPAPGIPGATFEFVDLPSAEYEGRTLFEATVTGGGVTPDNDEGIWIGAPGASVLLVREGDPAPGVPGGVFGSGVGGGMLEAAQIEGDRLAILARVRGIAIPQSSDQGIWASDGGPLALIAREGSQVPSAAPGVFYSALSLLRIDAAGRVAFRAQLGGAGVTTANDTAALAERAGALELLAREGDPAPGLPGNPYLAVEAIERDRDGPIAIRFADQGIWIANETGPPSPFALIGAAAPGGGSFASLSQICLDGGHVHVRGSSSLGVIGIWSGTATGLSALVRAGDPAPGAGAGITFASVQLAGCRGAHVVSIGTLAGPGVGPGDDSGVWAWRDGSLELVARAGDPIPVSRGLPDATFLVFDGASIHANGLVAFQTYLDYDPFLMSYVGRTIVREVAAGLRTVARDDRLLAVQPGDNRRIDGYLRFVPGFDDEGGIAIWAGFEDGSRVILRVPEPGSAALPGTAVLALLALRGRRRRLTRFLPAPPAAS